MNKIIITPRTYKKVFKAVQQHGQLSSPRGKQTREIINANLVLRNPIDRVIPDRERKINIAFAVAELYAFMFNVEDINFFTKFISTYNQFSTNGLTLDGAYGERVATYVPESLRPTEINKQLEERTVRSQLQAIVSKLQADSQDRQAVISIYHPLDTFGNGGKNTPCTLSLQFLIRNDKLDLITTMRSNDVYRGLPYDLFVFTMLQELVARAVGCQLGNYYHNVGSLHYYIEDEYKLERQNSKRDWPHLMTSMPSSMFEETALQFFKDGMRMAIDKEVNISEWYNRFIQHTQRHSSYTLETYEAISYYKNLLATVSAFINRKWNHKQALDAYGEINDKSLRRTLFPWLDPHIFSGKYKMKGSISG
jgi:thymidylate synthase